MSTLTESIGTRLPELPRSLAVEGPGGRVGTVAATVRLRLGRRQLLADLARGRIGRLADADARGELDIEGRLSDVMAVAGALVGDPLERGRPWSPGWWTSLRSQWCHRPGRDANQVRFHCDPSDDFHVLWPGPLRVNSCACYAEHGNTLAQAQQDRLDLVCRKPQLARGQRFLDIGAGWGGLLMRAAQHHGVQAVGITRSRHQHAHRCASASRPAACVAPTCTSSTVNCPSPGMPSYRGTRWWGAWPLSARA